MKMELEKTFQIWPANAESMTKDGEFFKSMKTDRAVTSQDKSSMNVVNYGAERGVKMGADFLQTGCTEEHCRNICKSWKVSGKRYQNHRKRKSQNK